MNPRSKLLRLARCALFGVSLALSITTVTFSQSADADDKSGRTATPIKHLIIVIGENRTFDHVFATYKPVSGDKIWNLLSKEIVKEDGTPGTNYGATLQFQASDTMSFQINPTKTAPYTVLPPALAGGPSTPWVCQDVGITTGRSCVRSANLAAAKAFENGLSDDYYQYLLTGGTGQPGGTPDARVMYDGKDANHLPGSISAYPRRPPENTNFSGSNGWLHSLLTPCRPYGRRRTTWADVDPRVGLAPTAPCRFAADMTPGLQRSVNTRSAATSVDACVGKP
jgi:hypothetical protein